MPATVKLESSDGCIFVLATEIARMSKTIRTLLDNLGHSEGDHEAIPLPNVTGEILEKVIAWCGYHQEDSNNQETGSNNDGDRAWDKNFFAVDVETLYRLTMAANYLDIRGLLDSACKAIADRISGKTPHEIREAMGIMDDFDQNSDHQGDQGDSG